jgi:hypothetical protein
MLVTSQGLLVVLAILIVLVLAVGSAITKYCLQKSEVQSSKDFGYGDQQSGTVRRESQYQSDCGSDGRGGTRPVAL